MKPDFRDTPIGKVFERTKRDLDLIQKDAEAKRFKSALQGVDYQIQVLTKLREDTKKALAWQVSA